MLLSYILLQNKGNTAQRTPYGFVRILLAYFPPYCTIRPSTHYALCAKRCIQPCVVLIAQSDADTKSEGVRPSGAGRAAQKGERTINLTAQYAHNLCAVLP